VIAALEDGELAERVLPGARSNTKPTESLKSSSGRERVEAGMKLFN
jgi:hypothetical protein